MQRRQRDTEWSLETVSQSDKEERWAGSMEGALRKTGGKLGPVTVKEAQSFQKEGDSTKAKHWWEKQEESHLRKNWGCCQRPKLLTADAAGGKHKPPAVGHSRVASGLVEGWRVACQEAMHRCPVCISAAWECHQLSHSFLT